MKTTTTNEAMMDFIAVAQQWMVKDESHAETKLGWAIQRMLLRLKKAQQRIEDRIAEIQIDNCVTDEKGIIVKDSRNQFEYTKEGAILRNKQLRELYEREIEVEPYIATELPMKDDKINLTIAEQEYFNGFVMHARQENPEAAQEEAVTVVQ
jgi:hypothetical protein